MGAFTRTRACAALVALVAASLVAAAAGSDAGGADDSDYVEQVHVTLSPSEASPGGLGVSFASEVSSDDAGVYFWPKLSPSDANVSFAPARRTTYNHFSKFGDYESPYLYHALLEGPKPGLEYEYAPVLHKSHRGTVFEIRVPPLASRYGGPTNQHFRLALVGDLGQTENSISTMKHLREDDDIEALLLVGDLSYADNLNYRWDVWGLLFQNVLSKLPLMALPGNHEIETDIQDGVSFKPYGNRFQMLPSCDDCGGFDHDGWKANMWYSFDVGSAHILHLSSYHDYDFNSPQYKWLKRDLESVDRSKTPWLIANLHAPWFNSNRVHQGEPQSVEVKKHWLPLLCEHKVNVMFAGHVHSYERILPTCDNSTVNAATGITFVNIGDGGNREGLYHNWLPGENGLAAPVWSAYREGSYGHGILEIFNETHAEWTWHRNQDPEFTIMDRVMIENNGYEPGLYRR